MFGVRNGTIEPWLGACFTIVIRRYDHTKSLLPCSKPLPCEHVLLPAFLLQAAEGKENNDVIHSMLENFCQSFRILVFASKVRKPRSRGRELHSVCSLMTAAKFIINENASDSRSIMRFDGFRC